MKKQVITALATPFLGGRLDVKSYFNLLEVQKASGCDILVAGTTAEGALLTVRERKILISIAREYLPDRELWVGISSGITKRAIKEVFWAQELGANGIMLCPPAFFKCTPQGFCEHVRLIKRTTSLPIMLYNAPSRCGYQLWKDSVEKLAKKQLVTCIKDAGTDCDYAKEIAKKIRLLCGNEEKLAEFIGAGGKGVVSVVSNVNPQLTERAVNCALTVYRAKKAAELHRELATHQEDCGENVAEVAATRAKTGELALSVATLRAREMYAEYQQLVKLAFAELNPIAVKYMLYKMGVFKSFEMRLPLSAANEHTRQMIDKYFR